MNIEALTQRIEVLQKTVDQGAGELNKILGRIEEAKMWLQHLHEKEAENKEPQDPPANEE